MRSVRRPKKNLILRWCIIAAALALALAAAFVLLFGLFHAHRREAVLVRDEEGRIVSILTAPVEDVSFLDFGDTGESVSALQNALAELGFYEAEATSFYGSDTVKAVAAFQSANGRIADGIADADTQYLLYSGTALSVSMAQRVKEQEAAALAQGTSLATAMSASGIVNGSSNVDVWDEKSGSFIEQAEGQSYESGRSTAGGDPDHLQIGDENERVREIQERLIELGYYSGSGASDFFGTMTLTAVCNFQKANGISPDGVCGTGTQSKLFSDSAVSYDSYIASGGLPYSARDDTIMQILAFAKGRIGCPYVWAGAGPGVFDCSGFTMYVYRHFGYGFGHGCSVQNSACPGPQLGRGSLQPGDLVFFDTNGGHNSLEHVGIYVGGGQFIHASSGGGHVMISSLNESYYSANFMWGKRVVPITND